MHDPNMKNHQPIVGIELSVSFMPHHLGLTALQFTIARYSCLEELP